MKPKIYRIDPEEVREVLSTFLRNGLVVVGFIKVDGSKRALYCTNNTGFIPKSDKESTKNIKSKIQRVQNDSVMCVFDLSQKKWKSFRLPSVVQFSVYDQKTDVWNKFRVVKKKRV